MTKFCISKENSHSIEIVLKRCNAETVMVTCYQTKYINIRQAFKKLFLQKVIVLRDRKIQDLAQLEIITYTITQ